MARAEKVEAVAEIKERMARAQAVFLAEYAGLSVKDQQLLRRNLRKSGAEFKVVKMTLARLAAAELELSGVDEMLLGPTGLTFADADAVTAAKALRDFAKDHEVFSIKGGLLGSDVLTPERVSALAEIEPRDVLLARMAGAVQAPLAKMAGLLQALPRSLASALQQLVDKRSDGAGPEESAPEESAPEESAPEESAPEESAPEESAPEESAPEATPEAADEPPVDEAPVDEAPVDEAPADEAPGKATDETPVDEIEAADTTEAPAAAGAAEQDEEE
jgi:large subunit ribosomal protein L10